MEKLTTVIKIGGNEMDDTTFVRGLANAVAAHQNKSTCVLVHGGGKAISRMMQAMQIEPKYIDGQRVTDGATLEIAEMVLSGKVNKQLVLALLEAGVDAIGISGVDQKLLEVKPWGERMNLVGRITKVRTDVLEAWFARNVVPVVSPISVGPAGRYNVNADHAAGMIAGRLKAEKVVFISNVPGVLIGDSLAEKLGKSDVEGLIADGTISGGMIPKVNAALEALNFGAQQAVITNLTGFKQGAGTLLVLERIHYGTTI